MNALRPQERGSATAEYALLLAVIAVASFASLTGLNQAVSGSLSPLKLSAQEQQNDCDGGTCSIMPGPQQIIDDLEFP